MSSIDRLVEANAAYASTFPDRARLARSCAWPSSAAWIRRLDTFGALGLQLGDAHVIRNGGGLATDDVLRSLAISQRKLGTREVLLIHHTDCGMAGLDDAAFRAELAAETGARPSWNVPGFSDVRAQVRESVRVVRECGWLPHREQVRGFVFDVTTARLDEVG